MNFQEAEYHYRRLRQQLAARQISPQQFAAQVARLRVQDAQGAWWQMRAQDGTWLQWNGRAWLPASLPQDGMRAPMKPVEQPAPPPSQRPSQPPVPPPQGYAMPQPAPAAARPASVPQKPPRKAPKPPKSLAELLLLLLKGYIKRWFIRLPLALAASLLVWVVHTFLLVGPNGGFAPGTNRILDLVLALQGRMVQGTLFWTLLSMLVASSLGRIFRTGPINTIQRVIATPGWVLHSFQQSRLAGAAILLGCGATTVLAGVIQGNLLNNFLLSLLVVGSLIAQRESFPGLVASLAWSDTQRLIKPKKTVPFQLAWVGAGLSGAALGFLWATLLTFSRYAPYCGCASVLLLLGIMVALIVVQKSKPALGATLLLLAVVGATAFSITPALADDGGWEEAGGDIGSWVQSEGAVKAVTMGIPPTLGAGIGVLIGLGLSTLGITLPGIPGLETGGTSIPGSEPPSETPAKQEEPSPEGPPPEGVILDGRQAIDALLQSGRIKPVPQPNGTIRYEPVNLNAGGDLRGICYTSTPDGLLGEGDVVILHEGGPSLRPSVEPQEPAVAPEPPAQPPADVEPVQPLKPEEPVQPPKPEEPVQPPEPKQPVEPPKAPGQELLEGVRDTSDAVKNAHDRVEGILDDLPIDDETRDAIREEINPIGEKAEEIKGYAEKGLEYIKVLDENLAETDKMKITPQSQEALGWWRVTFKAIGEVTEKFVDTVTEPFTSLFGEQGGEKVQEIIHEAVPIAEFGEELSKLPTSAARNIIGAQQRDQEGIDDIIDEIYPRDWSRQ